MIRIALLSGLWRTVAAALVVLALSAVPTYLLAAVFQPVPPPPSVMIRSFVIGTLVPWLTAAAILRVFRGTMAVRDGTLTLARPDVTLDVAGAVVVRPFWVPLPGPGLRLTLDTGARVPLRIVTDALAPLLDTLDGAGADTHAARRHPTAVWALGRPRRASWHLPAKFLLFGLVPACVVFYTHQHIAYGGTWGQWYLESPTAWWRTFAEYWGTTAILLMSYASFWRAAAEVVVWLVAAATPARAALARRVAEVVCAVAYYGGVPALLALRYLAP